MEIFFSDLSAVEIKYEKTMLSAFLFLLLTATAKAEDTYIRLHGVIHLDTNISDGVLSPEEMIKKVREAGIQVAIINDKDNQRVEYGIFPLRNIIKKVVERGSVMTYGARAYLERIKAIAKENPDMVILPGVEAVPFYYWTGGLFNRDLKLVGFHKHILVIGLKEASDYEGIPSVSYNNPAVPGIWCLINLWPLVLLIAGVWMARYRKARVIQFSRFKVTSTQRPFLIPGVLLGIGGVLLVINNFPYCPRLYEQYHGDRGILPYQNLIDYVNKKGGMTFWAHPEARGRFKIGDIELDTQPYYTDLLKARDYTGFAVFAEGMRYTGSPGGVWDKLLIEYVEGKRERPVWAIGELDYKEGNWMGDTQTVFLVKDKTKKEILDALRNGRVYAVMGEPKPVLEAFQVWDEVGERWVEMGETASVGGRTRIRIKVVLSDGRTMTLRLVRGGEVIKTIRFDGILDEEWEDNLPIQTRKAYYRVDIDSRLVTNPIFVRSW